MIQINKLHAKKYELQKTTGKDWTRTCYVVDNQSLTIRRSKHSVNKNNHTSGVV